MERYKMSYNPNEILSIVIQKGKSKATMPVYQTSALAFLAGAFIAIGYLAYIRVSGNLPAEWGGLPHFIGSCLFPIGLIFVLLGGGELVTGNMTVLGASFWAKEITIGQYAKNMLIVTLFNFFGSLFVAYFFGHVIGLTEGIFLEKTVEVASGKINAGFVEAFISGIGCNWIVGMAVWLNFGTKSFSGRFLAIWFPIMIFVLIGFQHVVANFFIIPAAIFVGELSWIDFFQNVIPVWLGNLVGGAIFVGGIYTFTYWKQVESSKTSSDVSLSQKRTYVS